MRPLCALSHIWYTPLMAMRGPKELVWIGSSLEDLRKFPDEVIMKLVKVSKEQLAAEITKHEQKRDEVYKK